MEELKKAYIKLTRCERCTILGMLEMSKNISQIAKRLHRSVSTISREIKRATVIKESYGYSKFDKVCPKLNKKYLVCNQCPKHNICHLNKRYYDVNTAIDTSYKTRHKCAKGPRIKASQLMLLNSEVTNAINKGQSLEYIHNFGIYASSVSCLTLRRYLYNGYFNVTAAQLRRKRRYSKKYEYKKTDYSRNAVNKVGRTMDDYNAFIKEHPNARIIQTDSVEGLKSDDIRLLTIMFVKESFQLAKRYDLKTASASVHLILTSIMTEVLLAKPNDEFVILTDNGTEFSLIHLLEEIDNRIHVFFADPYKSTDKANCERNHEFIRYVIPKGYSINDLTQEDIDRIMSNINSYARKGTKWKRPCDLFTESYGDAMLSKCSISKIDPLNVDLSSRY